MAQDEESLRRRSGTGRSSRQHASQACFERDKRENRPLVGRYYDPTIGQFLSVDPQGVMTPSARSEKTEVRAEAIRGQNRLEWMSFPPQRL
jgi:hypothetical protein